MKSIKHTLLLPAIAFFSINAYSQLWKQYSDSAIFFNNQGDRNKAVDFYLLAKNELSKDSSESLTYARICNSLGNIYLDLEKFTEAEVHYLLAKEIRFKLLGNQDPVYASSCNNLGVLNEDLGKFEKAVEYHKEALQIRAKLNPVKEHPSYAISCTNLAVTYVRMARFDLAEPLYLEGLKIREKNKEKNPVDYAESCNNLGALYMDIGLYEKAEPLYYEALAINKKDNKLNSGYIYNCNNLGLLYLYKADYEKAEPFFIESLEVEEKLNGTKTLGYSINCDNFALFYREIGQYKKAETLLLSSRKIKEELLPAGHPDLARTINHLAGLYLKMNLNEQAEMFFLETMKMREINPGKSSPDYATTCNDLATLYARQRMYKKAEPLFLEAFQVREKTLGPMHFLYSISAANLGSLNFDYGFYKKAEPYFLKAKNIREKSLGKEHPLYSGVCYDLANLYRIQKITGKAVGYLKEMEFSSNQHLKKFFRFTSEGEKQSYLKEFHKYQKALYSFYRENPSGSHQGLSYDVSLINRNITLSSSLHLNYVINSSADSGIKHKYNAWNDIKKQLAYWYLKPSAARPPYVMLLETRANDLEKELNHISSAFQKIQLQNDINWKTVQQHLKPEEAAIEFVEFNYMDGKQSTDSIFYIALLLRKDKPEPVLIRLFEKKQFDKITRDPEINSIETRTNSLYAGNTSLYNLTWKPIEKHLTGIKKIYFAPAGELLKIPFAALPVNEKLLLSDKYELVQLNTTATVTDNAESLFSPSDKIQLFGGIQYNADSSQLKDAVKLYSISKENTRSLPADISRSGSWNYLPGTQREISEIEKLAKERNLSVQISAGIAATEESVKSLDGNASPAILHIATHGFFFPDPGDNNKDSSQLVTDDGGNVFKQSDNPLFRSGLVLAGANNAWQGNTIEGIEDGILTAYEVSNMYFPNTKLVVLSACETALGDIQGSEGVYGLQRSFKIAGVQNLLMSLWKINDKETAEFMQLFYENLFNKQSVNNAFHNAQTIMKNKYRNEPYKWAAWVLIR